MGRLRALVVGCLIGVGAFAAPAPAQAAPGDTTVVCGNPVPAGWVVIALTYSGACRSGPGVLVNAWRIEQVDGFPIGTGVATCYGSTPPGWELTLAGIYLQQCTTNPPYPGYGYVITRRS
jgi:hypothetical protein